jgi:hypothetical protein
LVFSVQTNGLPASTTPYTDQVVITPLGGNPVTIDISLVITDSTPTPRVTPTVTILPDSSPTVTPSPTA